MRAAVATSASETGSGLPMAMYFGASSPKTMCRKVIPMKASATEIDVTTACRMNAGEREKPAASICSEKLFADPAERETGQSDAELGRGKIGIEMRANVLGETGAHDFLLRPARRAGCCGL